VNGESRLQQGEYHQVLLRMSATGDALTLATAMVTAFRLEVTALTRRQVDAALSGTPFIDVFFRHQQKTRSAPKPTTNF
jgi:hypothetical protein